MFLSLCIPIYNTDIRLLAKELHHQLLNISDEVELVFIDDASEIDFKRKNREVEAFCKYIELDFNVGRAKIRNLFNSHTKGKYLLFLDGDSIIYNPKFLFNYCNFLKENKEKWLMGGRIDRSEKPHRRFLLRWEYSRNRESKTIQERMNNKYLGFKSNNFIIEKELFERFPFDESIRTYGHEDTLFGYSLFKNGFNCIQIDNPVLNDDLDSNDLFLENTRHALKNLVAISEKLNDTFFEDQQVLLKKTKVVANSIWRKIIVYSISPVLSPILKFCLSKGYFKLWMFDLFRFIELFYILLGRKNKSN
jgi:hypothetical protein